MDCSNRRLAAVQFAPVLREVEANRAASVNLIERAATGGAQLIVLPECCIAGYMFSSRDELALFAEPIPGPSVRAWQDVSQRTGAWIAAGLAERAGDRVYNSAVLVGPSGELHVYRKLHLWGIERQLYDAGSDMICVQTPFGKIGLAICYDLWFPELGRKLALAGATLIAAPANWSRNPKTPGGVDRLGLPLGYYVSAATACVNELVVVSADRTGEEGGVRFLGSSCIMGPNGRELALPACAEEDTIIYADWPDVEAIRRAGHSHLNARRPDVYDREVLEGVTGAHPFSGLHTIPGCS